MHHEMLLIQHTSILYLTIGFLLKATMPFLNGWKKNMKLSNTYAIGCHVMFYEIDMVPDYMDLSLIHI